jgi:superfamily I DNA/RNA helicase
MEFSEKDKSNHHEIPFGCNFIDTFKKSFQDHEGNSRGVKGKGLLAKNKYLACSLSSIKNGDNLFRKSTLNSMLEFSKKEGFKLPSEIETTIKEDFYYDKIETIEYLPEKIPMWDLEVEEDHSYVMHGYVCHNSQGLEYPLVIIPFIKAHGALLLQRNLLYTAITRAKKKVIILGQASAIESAIQNSKMQRRNTRFGERIQEWMHGKGTSMHDIYSNYSNYQNAEVLKRLLSLEEKGG